MKGSVRAAFSGSSKGVWSHAVWPLALLGLARLKGSRTEQRRQRVSKDRRSPWGLGLCLHWGTGIRPIAASSALFVCLSGSPISCRRRPESHHRTLASERIKSTQPHLDCRISTPAPSCTWPAHPVPCAQLLTIHCRICPKMSRQ